MSRREIKLCEGHLGQRNAVFIDTVFINPVIYKSIDYSTKTFFLHYSADCEHYLKSANDVLS